MNPHIGQHMVIGLKGPILLPEEAEFIVRHNIGGVIFFKRNVESPEQIRQLTLDIQSLRHRMPDRAPLFIGIDMEGGRVARLKAPFTQWPAAAAFGKIDSTSVAFKFAMQMGEELRAVGLNLNFAPCVDVLTNPQNEVIGDRAYSTDPEMVSKLASAVVRGFIKSEVIPCAKHFPGHGNTLLDSHEDLPIESKTWEEMQNVELNPFKKVFRARLDMVLTAHVKFPAIDPQWPATLSPKILSLLKDELRFRGLVITDDLGMKALTKHYSTEQIATQAIQAGCHLLLYCNEFDTPPIAYAALEKAVSDKSLSASLLAENHKKILELKKTKLAQPEPKSAEEIQRIVGHPDHLRLAKSVLSGEIPEDLIANT